MPGRVANAIQCLFLMESSRIGHVLLGFASISHLHANSSISVTPNIKGSTSSTLCPRRWRSSNCKWSNSSKFCQNMFWILNTSTNLRHPMLRMHFDLIYELFLTLSVKGPRFPPRGSRKIVWDVQSRSLRLNQSCIVKTVLQCATMRRMDSGKKNN